MVDCFLETSESRLQDAIEKNTKQLEQQNELYARQIQLMEAANGKFALLLNNIHDQCTTMSIEFNDIMNIIKKKYDV